jgi:hypothetical protein
MNRNILGVLTLNPDAAKNKIIVSNNDWLFRMIIYSCEMIFSKNKNRPQGY